MKVKKNILKRIEELLLVNENVINDDGTWNQLNMKKGILGTLTLINMTYGPRSNQETFLTSLRDTFYNESPHQINVWSITTYISSTLETLRSDIGYDFIESIEKKAEGEVYSDLLSLAKN